MSVDVFSLDEFEKALKEAALGLDVRMAGVVGHEYQFAIHVKKFPAVDQVVTVLVNSSVEAGTGMSASSGENSIRGWLADSEGKPLGSKTQRWVTRQKGWKDRLKTMISNLAMMAKSLNYCQRCASIEKVLIVKKEGGTKGKLFKRCDCDNSFRWLPDNGNGVIEDITPNCPVCGALMRKRDGKFGEFWGCSQYPACRGTLNIGQEAQTSADREDCQYKLNSRLSDADVHDDKIHKFSPSENQRAIFDWVDGSGKNLVVEALAGSGKTTTGVELLKRIPRNNRILFVAFNKHIARELQRRVPNHIKATTLHSLGFAACRQALKLTHEDVKSDKVRIILEPYMDLKANGYMLSPITKLVSLVKANLIDTLSTAALENLAEFYGIELNGDAEVIFNAARYTIKKSIEMVNIIDFDDMCWLPVALNLPCQKYDFIFVDEAQDLNKVQLALVDAHRHENTRFVAVGDRYQSLYGFRGASVESMPEIIETFEADVLPLSITYRCPTSVVKLVNETFPNIPLAASEWAQDGEIRHEGYDIALRAMRPGDMALCRTNAPLVKPCFELIRNGVKAVIRGRDIGKGLISLIRKMKADGIADLIFKLTSYRDVEVAKLLIAKKNGAAQALGDKVDTVIALADSVEVILELEQKIESVFSDAVEGVVFSSVHRAKGLESNTVFILEPGLMPHPMATQDWELQQEKNIEYVAYTRTKEVLVFVS